VPQGEALPVSYSGVNKGPVKILSTSTDPILSSAAMTYSQNGTVVSYSEMLTLPNSQLDKVYWLPWYNSKTEDTQLRIANVSGAVATVHVKIGGSPVAGSPFTLQPGAVLRKVFPNLDKGPVKVQSNGNVVVSERVIHRVNGADTSYSEMLALPNSQLDKVYWLPWYNSKTEDTQLRIANVSGAVATVHVKIGGSPVAGSPFTLQPGAVLRKVFPNLDQGPVKVQSNGNVVVSERVIHSVNGVDTSYSEMMALPAKQLHTTHWLPWYNTSNMDTQLRIANVSAAQATVHVFLGGTEVAGSPFSLLAGQSVKKVFPGLDSGPLKVVSNGNVVVSERVIYRVNGVDASYSEMLALPQSQLSTLYRLPWYNNSDLSTNLLIAVP
jgi:ABC-type glucose/galactose transport system permease subunit